jgi:hypothetical protein
MKLRIDIKRRLLVLVLVTIVAGNIMRLTDGVSTNSALILETPIYAESSFETVLMRPPNQSFNYNDSSLLTIDKRIEDIDLNPENIRKIEAYLSARGAPLADQAYYFEKMAVKYDLPYNLMPAISVIESSGGMYNYRPYNYAGLGGQGAAMSFNSFEEAIEKHAQILRYGYFDVGANTPTKIAPYYCPPCTTWHIKVDSVMAEIEAQ